MHMTPKAALLIVTPPPRRKRRAAEQACKNRDGDCALYVERDCANDIFRVDLVIFWEGHTANKARG